MNIRTIILTIMISGSLMMMASAETYISYVDDGLGFYKVRDVTTPTNKFTYENRVLTINQGDTVIWENDAQKTSFTIVSEQNLWDDKVGYLRVGSKLNYKFDKPGKYTLYIKEYSSRHQTVVINSVGGYSTPTVVTTTAPTPIKAPVPTNTISSSETVMTPVPIVTPIIHIPINSTGNSTGYSIQFPDIKLPIRISVTTIASIIVAILSIIITYKTGKNKR